MQRFFTLRRLVVLIGIGGVLIVPATAHTAVAPPVVWAAWKATGTPVRSLECVSAAQIRKITGQSLTAATNLRDRRVLLQAIHCTSLERHQATGQLNGWVPSAYITIGHEAAHLRGVRSERKAECAGVRFAYAYMKRIGIFAKYSESSLVHFLLDDSRRDPAAKLNGTCHLGGR
jgi:hypothetical protein